MPALRHSGGRLKGGESDLGFYVNHDGAVLPGDPSTPVRTGDAVQFTYRTSADHLVLLSVDADGVVSVFWPAPGHGASTDRGVDVVPGERHVLDGSVILDDAPSPEVFVGFFGDWTVDAARARASGAYASGGIEAVIDLGGGGAEGDGDIAVLPLEKLD